MSRSLAAVVHEAGRELEMRQLARPEPCGEEVLVRVLGCTLCGSDLHTFDGRRAAAEAFSRSHDSGRIRIGVRPS